MCESDAAARSLQLLRRQRHSFLNHLQVISGWLQLEKPERARQYLESVAARMTGESETLRQAAPGLALLMLELGLEAETHGAHLEWRIAGPEQSPPEGLLEQLRAQVLAALQTNAPGAGIVIDLTVPGFSVHSPTEQGKG
ncbi:MAG TPA: Spo0B domain-containing protein [Symbiobacteriaceae bacterium]|nr:Spo0B domain-containing protein [Symbiobacteriaceae bacterium]